MLGDTIAALSTPRGKGGVALIRISGPEALCVADAVFSPHNRQKLSGAESRRAIYGSISVKEPDGSFRAIDDGLATVFRAPSSFTGEDTVEICCHGGILLTEMVLGAVFAAGARPAQAGEFTRRAFLNGKMGLSAAEALADLLEAQTGDQLRLAHNGMRGATEAYCEALYAELRRVLASVYACIDYPDEDLADMSQGEMEQALLASRTKLQELCNTYRTGHAVAEGIRTVICGKPNVGKSSLFNRLLGREAAIVTDVEGTTRDLLTATAALGKVTLHLCDTAGIHTSEDLVEQIGINRAKAELEQAELILALFDGSRQPDEKDLALCRLLEGRHAPAVAILNKSDLSDTAALSFYRERFSSCIVLSAKTGDGFSELKDTVEALFTDGKLELSTDAVLSNARQYASAVQALQALDGAIEALRAELPMDICCSSVESAMSYLSELDGRAVSEDLVSEIFSHFCVGK